MGKADRLLLILNLLRSRRNLTAVDLSHECEVSERTIYRDIQALSGARVPIYFDHGYKLLTDAFLPPLNFTLDELVAIHIGLTSDAVESLDSLRRSAKQALAKLQSLIPEQVAPDYKKMNECIFVRPKSERSKPGMALIFGLLRQAIQKKKKVRLHLVSAENVDPIELIPEALIYQKGSWYVSDQTKGNEKSLRLDRVKTVEFLKSDSPLE
jgi:predicted DNA-binding transcriptional regulator YafY